jgi:hypothetical protein
VPQPDAAPWLAPSSSPVRPAASSTSPGRSNRAPGLRPGASAAGTNRIESAPSAPSGTLIRKIIRQPPAPISAPPAVGPIAGPRNSRMPASGEIAREPPDPPSSMLIASGTSGAATRPWRTRAPTRNPASGASAHSADAIVKAITLARYTGSVPNRRAR